MIEQFGAEKTLKIMQLQPVLTWEVCMTEPHSVWKCLNMSYSAGIDFAGVLANCATEQKQSQYWTPLFEMTAPSSGVITSECFYSHCNLIAQNLMMKSALWKTMSEKNHCTCLVSSPIYIMFQFADNSWLGSSTSKVKQKTCLSHAQLYRHQWPECWDTLRPPVPRCSQVLDVLYLVLVGGLFIGCTVLQDNSF